MLIGLNGSCPYAIGDIIYSDNSDFDPNKLYIGTTWLRIKGKIIAGVDESDADFNTVRKLGGIKSFNNAHIHGTKGVSLTNGQLPKLDGSVLNHGGENGSSFWQPSGVFQTSPIVSGKYRQAGASLNGASSIASNIRFQVGNNEEHSHGNTDLSGTTSQTVLQPYITKYIWERKA